MIHTARLVLYCILFTFAVTTVALCVVRTNYTIFIPAGDITNSGIPFYDPIVVELLVTSILTMLWAPFVALIVAGWLESRFFSSFAAEVIVLFMLFVFWLVGAAIATHTSDPPQSNIHWGDLSSCWSTWQCRELTAILALAWSCCIVAFALLVTSLWFTIAKKAWRDPMHGRWDYRSSLHSNPPVANMP